jgi:hypothetical protein
MELDTLILQYETAIRLMMFVGVFLLMAGWELAAPCRQLTVSKSQRWQSNLALVVMNTLMLRLLFPIVAIGVAVFAAEQGWGLFNYIAWPVWLAVVVLDLVIYLQHVMVHAIPLLWRLHPPRYMESYANSERSSARPRKGLATCSSFRSEAKKVQQLHTRPVKSLESRCVSEATRTAEA